MTLTEIPSARTAVMAGRPALVAGILISRFGRSTIFHNSMACAMVLSVSSASRGSTSIDTRPSTPSEASHCGGQHVAGVAHVVGGDGADGGVDVGAALGQLGDLRVVGVAVRQRLLEDRRVRGHADDALGVDQLLQVARLQPVARQVVEPNRYPRGAERGEVGILTSSESSFSQLSIRVRSAASATASAVKPNSRNKVLASADSP